MPEIHIWWWWVLKRCLLLLAEGWGLVRLVLLTPESQVPVIFLIGLTVQMMEWFHWRAFEQGSPATLKGLPLKVLRYNFQSRWAKYSLAVSALVEIASLMFCRCTQRGSRLGFLAAYHKATRLSGGHRRGHLKFRLIKEKKLSRRVCAFPRVSGLGGERGQCWRSKWRGAHREYGLCSSTLFIKEEGTY